MYQTFTIFKGEDADHMKYSVVLRNKHLVIIFVSLLVTAFSFSISYTPLAKGDLGGPYYVRGYIKQWNGTAVPSGVTVTITNNENDNSGTATTTGSNGAYQINVGKDSGFDCTNGDQIVVNCSYSSQVGENDTTIDTTGATFAWCNLTGGTRLQNQSLSINVSPWNWAAGSIDYGSWNATSNTYFNLTNQGNVNINVKIHGYNISYGGNYWNLTSSVGVNNYTLKYQKSGAGTWTAIGLANASFVTDLEFNSDYFDYTFWQKFGLNLSMPTSVAPTPSGSLSTSVRFWSELA